MKKQVASLFALLALLLWVPAAAFSSEEIELEEGSHLEQVIPPAMFNEDQFEIVSEPLNFDEIVVTEQTPADRFVSATTPLVVALMLGSVGLVIFTLTRVER